MAIRGSLREASLPDVIQLLFLGRRTGCLAVTDRQRFGSIYFEDGWIVYATIVNRRDRIGDILLRAGLVTREQLDEALAMQQVARGRRLGEILVSLGAVTAEELRLRLRAQLEEAVFALFSWSTGTFTFEAGVRPDWETGLGRINPENLLLEGARRIDEWSLIEKKIPSFDLVFALDRQAPAGELSFTEAQRRLLPLIDGVRDTREVIDASGLSDFEAAQALFGLVTAGVAQRVGTSSRAAPSRLLEAQIEEHRNLGIAFLRTDMLEEAGREFRRVMELRPSEGSAPFYLGIIAARQRRWADAVDHFRRALDRSGPRGAVLHNLAVALEEVGRLDQAEALAADAAGRLPDDPAVLLNWGLVALGRDDARLAWARLDRARELVGRGAPPPLWFWAAARALADLDQLDRALEVAREGVQAHPQHPVLRNNCAVLLEVAGEVGPALDLLQATVQDDPAVAQPFKNLGDLLYRAGRYDEAGAAYERAATLAPELGDDLFFKLGNLAFRRRDAARARECWERTLALNPGHQLARANLDLLAVSA
jgi:tetratricopeptide (TPR) repeat protein